MQNRIHSSVFQKRNAPLFTVVNLKRSPSSSSLPSPLAFSDFREVCCSTKYICAAWPSATCSSVDLWYNLFFYIQFMSCWQLFNNSDLWLCNTLHLASTGREVQPEPSVVLGPFSKADLDISFHYEFMAFWEAHSPRSQSISTSCWV